RPTVGETTGLALVWSLSALTMLAALLVWRGKWQPDSPSFAPRFCALTLGVLVTSYHSHPHGAALLIVRLAAAWAAPAFQFATRVVTWVAVYALTFVVIWITGILEGMAVSPDSNVPLWTVWPNVLPGALFMLAFGLMCVDLWTVRHAYR